jgi:hypothetical protein
VKITTLDNTVEVQCEGPGCTVTCQADAEVPMPRWQCNGWLTVTECNMGLPVNWKQIMHHFHDPKCHARWADPDLARREREHEEALIDMAQQIRGLHAELLASRMREQEALLECALTRRTRHLDHHFWPHGRPRVSA